ncbi:sugar phosphate isomerase/epimerase [Acidisoma cellulosilytica]|uniref:Sugar phosphate isomerase/epimerase n=1 Tax=Acidisoma cellulosilyticum TaxID=2802395 RepID=A0A963Z3U1_9PROT|nr:TIM barrel protein [Acidisoma cellulosilyticum]MCB8882099.1 sugar phosphate isomerase/epimerase [Acidisoma cellulosilyticum]
MQQLLVFQSLWGMQRLRGEHAAPSLADQIARIAAAGFDGVTDHFYDRTHVAPLAALLRQHGLTIEGQAFPRDVAGLEPALAMAAEFGCHHITIQPLICPMTVADCVPILQGWQRLAEQAGVAVYIETHRGRMTNDLLFTLQLLDAFPHLRFTADLSHYVTAREMELPIPDETEAQMTRILDQAWAFHGRVAGSHQVQLPLGFPQHQPWVAQFARWWQQGFASWRQRAPADATLSFTCELGPAPYAIAGADGQDLTDRWKEALLLKDKARALWADGDQG